MHTSRALVLVLLWLGLGVSACDQLGASVGSAKLAQGRYNVSAQVRGGARQFNDVIMLCSEDAVASFPTESALSHLQDRMNLTFYKPSSTNSEYPCEIGAIERSGAKFTAQGACTIPRLAETQHFAYDGSVSSRGFRIGVSRTMEFGQPRGDFDTAEQRRGQVRPVTEFTVTGSLAGAC